MKTAEPTALSRPQLAALRSLPLPLRLVHAFVRQALEDTGLAIATTDADGDAWLTATREGLIARDAAKRERDAK